MANLMAEARRDGAIDGKTYQDTNLREGMGGGFVGASSRPDDEEEVIEEVERGPVGKTTAAKK